MLGVAPAAAENGKVSSNTATAVLHLQVTVLPVTFVAPPPAIENTSAVSFRIPVRPAFVDVTEQVRELPVGNTSASGSQLSSGVVRTTVVLPK